MGSLVFLVQLNELNQFEGNALSIKIPFLVDLPQYENGFNVWMVLVMTLPTETAHSIEHGPENDLAILWRRVTAIVFAHDERTNRWNAFAAAPVRHPSSS